MGYDIIKITTTKIDGDMYDEKNRQEFMEYIGLPFPMLTTAEQVHGSVVHSVSTEVAGRRISGADGLVTCVPGLPLGIFTADCAPVFIAEKDNRFVKKVGILHAGRRGVSSGIIEKGLSFFDNPDNLFVHTGPHICGKCYAVDNKDISGFLSGYKDGHLDISAEIKYRAMSAGIPRQNITSVASSDMCTYHQGDLFYSYRRGDKEERMLSLVCFR